MYNDPKAELELIEEMTRKGSRKGSKSVLLPRWAGLSISILAGLSFTAVVEFGPLGVLVIPAVFLIFLIHYIKSDTWPYFWPTKDAIKQTKCDSNVNPAYILYLAFAICGGVSVPFLLIKATELKDNGVMWISYTGGVVVMIFAGIVFELERHFANNK